MTQGALKHLGASFGGDKEKKGTKGMNRQSRPERMGWFPAQENAHAETEISLADGGSIPPISTII